MIRLTNTEFGRVLYTLGKLTLQLAPPQRNIPTPVLPLNEGIKKLEQITNEVNESVNGTITPKILGMFALILDNMDSLGLIFDESCTILYVNPAAQQLSPKLKAGMKCYETFGFVSENNAMCKEPCIAKEVLASKKPVSAAWKMPDDPANQFSAMIVPLTIDHNHLRKLVLIIATRRTK